MGYAITARFVGPTNSRGSRVIATGPALTHDGSPVRATVGWDYGAGNPDGIGMASGPTPYAGWGDHDANYRRAADAVVAKLRAAGWTVSLAPDDRGATLPDERTTVYVLRYGAE
jgi:hypothetical protein